VSQATVILLLGSPITTFLTFLESGQLAFYKLTGSFLIILGIVLIIGIKKIKALIEDIKALIYVRA
jgi:drug/metabolite transporter (DMT)-like permease